MPTSMAPFTLLFVCAQCLLLSINLLYGCTEVVKGGTCSNNTKVGGC